MSIFSTPSIQTPSEEEIPYAEEIPLPADRGGMDRPLFQNQNALPGLAQAPDRRPTGANQPAPAPTSEVAEQLAVVHCPRCQGKLIDPQGMGWCRACGYCKSIEEDKGKLPVAKKPVPRKESVLGVVEFFILLTKIPGWAYVLVFGCGGVFAASLVPARQLPLDSLLRASWTTIQIGVGLGFMFLAQLIILFALAPTDEKLSFKDAVLPFRLWPMALQRGGRFRVPFWIAAWGLSAIIAAVVIIGGLDHWYRYIPRSKPPEEPPPVVAPKKR